MVRTRTATRLSFLAFPISSSIRPPTIMSLYNYTIDDFDPVIRYSNYADWQTPNPQDNPTWFNATPAVTGSPWHEGGSGGPSAAFPLLEDEPSFNARLISLKSGPTTRLRRSDVSLHYRSWRNGLLQLHR